MKPNGILLKWSCVNRQVAYMNLSGGEISKPRDEWKIYLVDKDGNGFSRFAPDDTGRIYRWSRFYSNHRGKPPVEVATDLFDKIMKTREALIVIEDNRPPLA